MDDLTENYDLNIVAKELQLKIDKQLKRIEWIKAGNNNNKNHKNRNTILFTKTKHKLRYNLRNNTRSKSRCLLGQLHNNRSNPLPSPHNLRPLHSPSLSPINRIMHISNHILSLPSQVLTPQSLPFLSPPNNPLSLIPHPSHRHSKIHKILQSQFPHRLPSPQRFPIIPSPVSLHALQLSLRLSFCGPCAGSRAEAGKKPEETTAEQTAKAEKGMEQKGGFTAVFGIAWGNDGKD